MRSFILATAVVFSCQSTLVEAASRTWTNRAGQEVKADFTGVKDGLIVLKVAGRRIQVRFSDLSLADRDYLVDLLLNQRGKDRDKAQLLELIAAESRVMPIDPDKVTTNPNNGTDGDTDPMNDPMNMVDPMTGLPILRPQQAPVSTPKEMYGLPLPSSELLIDDPVRTWTSITNVKVVARLDRVLAPGFLRLKKADGTTQSLALVNFSKADIDYVKTALEKDFARPVFPVNSGFQSLTSDDVAKGYRVWTDRKQQSLVGKFVNITNNKVVIESNAGQQSFPKGGLSESDRNWVNAEVRRRAEEAAQAARDAAQANSSGGGYNPGGGFDSTSRPSAFPRPTFPRPSPFPRRSPFGGSNTDPMGDDYADATETNTNPNPRPFGGYRDPSTNLGESSPPTFLDPPEIPRIQFNFKCDKCGHTWTRSDTSIDKCPQCSGQARQMNQGSGTSKSTEKPNEVSGVLRSILYIVCGLGILGGIVGGLMKQFG